MKILLIDIEVSAHKADVWGLWDQNIPLSHLLEASETICWSAKWYGEESVTFSSVNYTSKKKMVQAAWDMLDEADVVVHYNGTKFDIPTLNKEFLLQGLPPPSPFKEIDLLTTVRNRFKFASNKLAYVALVLGLEGKVSHEGHGLWRRCAEGDQEAWALMEEYNIQDTLLLEDVYTILRPWIRNHPNQAVYSQTTGLVCRVCGGTNYQKRGFSFTTTKKYQRYRCKDCKSWFRDNVHVGHKVENTFNVV